MAANDEAYTGRDKKASQVEYKLRLHVETYFWILSFPLAYSIARATHTSRFVLLQIKHRCTRKRGVIATKTERILNDVRILQWSKRNLEKNV